MAKTKLFGMKVDTSFKGLRKGLTSVRHSMTNSYTGGSRRRKRSRRLF